MCSVRMFKIYFAGVLLLFAVACAAKKRGRTENLLSSKNQAGETSFAKANLPAAQKAALIPQNTQWSGLIHLPLVPAAAANLTDGRVLFWASSDRFNFNTNVYGKTETVILDPAALSIEEKLVTETGHDMFCPGTTNLQDGRILVNGGKDTRKTTIFDPASKTWVSSGLMNIGRGYESNTILADGSVLTFGGSWSGNLNEAKDAEIWSNGYWRRLSNVKMTGDFHAEATKPTHVDNHFWLFPMSNGQVLHAGPSVRMHWLDTAGEGSVSAAGTRGDDQSSLNGSAVMYDIDKILKVGGLRDYGELGTMLASSSAHLIELDTSGRLNVNRVASMHYARGFSNGVVLPNGQVVIVGGQTYPKVFSDDNAVLTPEIWDPVTKGFVTLPAPPNPVARAYHSVAILLTDARVLVAGGGLSGNPQTDHPDAQIMSPPYLFDAQGKPARRPSIVQAPGEALNGASLRVTTDSEIGSFALMRMSSVTHSIANDQRRIPLVMHALGGNSYDLDIPANKNVVLPGVYMLFAMSSDGVPSIAKLVRIGAKRPDDHGLIAVGPAEGSAEPVRIFDVRVGPTAVAEFYPFGAGYTGGIRVALGDVTGDGHADLIAGTGKGQVPEIRVIDGQSGRVVEGLNLKPFSGTGGVSVAAGDIDGDGRTEILAGSGPGPIAAVKVYKADGTLLREIQAYENAYTLGVRVALGDVNGDGAADILLSTPPGGGPRLRVLDGRTSAVLADEFVYEDTFRGGVWVAAGDADGDGRAEVIVGADEGGGPRVRVLKIPGLAAIQDFFAYSPDFRGGVRVAAIDQDGDGKIEIALSPGVGGGPHVRVVRAIDGREIDAPGNNFFASDPASRSGFYISGILVPK